MLCIRYSDRKRRMLRAGERNNERRLLFGPGRSAEPLELPGTNPNNHYVCGRLYQNVGWFLLQ